MRGYEEQSEGQGSETELPAADPEHKPARWRPRWILYAVGVVIVALVSTYVVSQRWTRDTSGEPPIVIETSTPGPSASAPPDSDGDGILDAVELAGWATQDGRVYRTDPFKADTDGDGLADGEEAGTLLSNAGSQWLYAGVSDPTKVDSDDDGLDDKAEVRGWRRQRGGFYQTNPMRADTDGDGLTDGVEAGALISDDAVLPIYAGISDPTKIDSDDDGLDDRTEVQGWKTPRGGFHRSDPMMADSDGDGLTDAEEADVLLSDHGPVKEYSGFSDPLLADTDGDGLTDAEEADLSLDPFNVDTDGDGLDDAYESNVLGTSPDVADTDGDGLDDGYEVANQESQGLDPLVFDEKVDKWVYALDFAKGAVAGDLWREDSLAWLSGNLVAGGASFIPGVGWIIGTVADVRDTIGSAIHADWVGAGFSLVGLVPEIGDVVAVPGKAARFAKRVPALAADAAAHVVGIKKIPEDIKFKGLVAVQPRVSEVLAAGASKKATIRLAGGRTNLDGLAADLNRPGHIKGSTTKFMADGKDGEKFLERELRKSSKTVGTQVSAKTAGCVQVCNALARRFDVVADGVAHESKVGPVPFSASIEKQIRSDAYLIETGEIIGAQWHFFPSAKSDSLGADKRVLDLLEELGIPYTIHLPSTG